jgi:hypothetical protein
MLPFSSGAANVLPSVVSFFLQALNKVIDSATISRVLIPEEVNLFMVFILLIIKKSSEINQPLCPAPQVLFRQDEPLFPNQIVHTS